MSDEAEQSANEQFEKQTKIAGKTIDLFAKTIEAIKEFETGISNAPKALTKITGGIGIFYQMIGASQAVVNAPEGKKIETIALEGGDLGVSTLAGLVGLAVGGPVVSLFAIGVTSLFYSQFVRPGAPVTEQMLSDTLPTITNENGVVVVDFSSDDGTSQAQLTITDQGNIALSDSEGVSIELVYDAEGNVTNVALFMDDKGITIDNESEEIIFDDGSGNPPIVVDLNDEAPDQALLDAIEEMAEGLKQPILDELGEEFPIDDFIPEPFINADGELEFPKPITDLTPPIPGFKPTPIGDAEDPFGEAPMRESPLVIDLDGDGLEFTAFDPANTTFFDLDGDGTAEQTGWVTYGR